MAPFVIIAVIAEVSVLVPPGPQNIAALLVSLALLALVAGAFWLPWEDLPDWSRALVPLTYCASVLALVLATGQGASGVGTVIWAPVIWSALFGRLSESLLVVGGVIVVEVVTALTPVHLSDAVIARRVVFWAVLGLVTSIAVHGLRARAARAHAEAVRLQELLAENALQADRARIATELHQINYSAPHRGQFPSRRDDQLHQGRGGDGAHPPCCG